MHRVTANTVRGLSEPTSLCGRSPLGHDRRTTKGLCDTSLVLAEREEPTYQPNVNSMFDIVQIVKYLLGLCERTHTHNKSFAKDTWWMPTRVLDISNRRTRLVAGSEVESEQYAIMSYCWGAKSHEHQLTKHNCAKYQEQIPETNLPTTIKEAISLVRLLDIRYMWIDAMCIIQDDDNDWKAESQRMHKTYSSAHICISALQSTSSHAGLYAKREEPQEIKYNMRPWSRRATTFSSAFKSFPLNQRAWTLQERLLSTRLLHIAAPDFWFECGAGIIRLNDWYNCNNINETISSTGTFLGLDAFDKIIAQTSGTMEPIDSKILISWYQLILDYCPRRLSFEEDRLVAIEGLKTLYQRYMRCSYFYGIWKSDIYNGLLWFNGRRNDCMISGCLLDPLSVGLSTTMDRLESVELLLHGHKDKNQIMKEEVPALDTQDFTANMSDRTPSWSWASVSSKYTNFCCIDGKSAERLRVTFHQVTRLTIPDTPVPCLEMTGTLARLKITTDLLISQCEYAVQAGRVVMKGNSTIFLDKATPEPLEECHALLFYESGFDGKSMSSTSHLTLLLLEEVPEGQVFRRIGLAFLMVTLEHSWQYLDMFKEKEDRIWLI
jgi:hypothetical protein